MPGPSDFIKGELDIIRIIVILLISGLLLSACSKDKESVSAEGETFTYPEAVENEIISGEMYWQIRKFIEDINRYSSAELEYKTNLLDMVDNTYNADVISSYNNHLNERESMLSEQLLEPTTKVDEMFTDNMEKYIAHSQKSIMHMRVFTDEFDFSYFDLASIEIEMANSYLNDFLKLCESYGLLDETN